MLDNAFLRSLGIREELLPKEGELKEDQEIIDNPKKEVNSWTNLEPIEAHRDDVNMLIRDYGEVNEIQCFPYANGFIIGIYPDQHDPDYLMFTAGECHDRFTEYLEALPQPLEGIVGCRDDDESWWYYVPAGDLDIEALAKIRHIPF
jgi:hypothetical protein